MAARTTARKTPTKGIRTYVRQTTQDHRLTMSKEDNSVPPTSCTPQTNPPMRHTSHMVHGPLRYTRQYKKTTPTVEHKGVPPCERPLILETPNTTQVHTTGEGINSIHYDEDISNFTCIGTTDADP